MRLAAHAIGQLAVEQEAADRCGEGIAVAGIVEQYPADAVGSPGTELEFAL